MGTKKRIMITVVGEPFVGKTNLCTVFAENEFFEDIFCGTFFGAYLNCITVDGQEVEIGLRDTMGHEDYDRLRRSCCYHEADCFLLCYTVDYRHSFEKIVDRWYPELNHYGRSVPIVLVATRIDLRAAAKDAVTTQEGEKLRKKIGAAGLVECSARERVNLYEVFEVAARAVFLKKPVPKRTCEYL